MYFWLRIKNAAAAAKTEVITISSVSFLAPHLESGSFWCDWLLAATNKEVHLDTTTPREKK